MRYIKNLTEENLEGQSASGKYQLPAGRVNYLEDDQVEDALKVFGDKVVEIAESTKPGEPGKEVKRKGKSTKSKPKK